MTKLAYGIALFAFAALYAHAQLTLYDNFSSGRIDPAKWLAEGGDPDLREVVRSLVVPPARRLHLSQTAYSATTDDNGTSGGLFGLAFPVPSAITEVSFSVGVTSATATPCASNPSGGFVTAAEFRGNFFNTGTSPTSSIGDVQAVIGIERNPQGFGNALTVHAFYAQCDDQFCGNQTVLDSRVLGSVIAGSTNTLFIQWDQPNHQFIFQLNKQPKVVSPYAVSDSSPPFFAFKAIDLARVVPHCTTTPRPFTSIDAFVHNVFVNP